MAVCMRSSTSAVQKHSSTTRAVAQLRPRVQRTPFVAQAFFGSKAKAAPKAAPKRETLAPEPSFNLQLGLLGLAGVSGYAENYGLAGFLGLLGVFLTIQATRIRFVFDDTGLEVLRAGKESENVIVGGRNRWEYSSFINWEFWFPGFPVLVYFKENQTNPEGQVHFFPIIFNGKQLYEAMVERCGPSKTSGPK
ncbi:hypothetical protein HYH02_005000 [Chlamydomonas schloesseri]|uniref:DUF3119 family protein n=1 Tax=Chlamydomonas schloesseri TaxID=2026947 RepID=A0A835WNI6_9CHLO|nr:hypothetical protein HYH02_005000 [Chlamydomonas schloesseri]|eukprot:KAG2450499.1 hypothetical protein HYH02_005000 [Chlamydomonas schloesseri]